MEEWILKHDHDCKPSTNVPLHELLNAHAAFMPLSYVRRCRCHHASILIYSSRGDICDCGLFVVVLTVSVVTCMSYPYSYDGILVFGKWAAIGISIPLYPGFVRADCRGRGPPCPWKYLDIDACTLCSASKKRGGTYHP
eukprot:2415277-Pleurochrysis_carterae.AAC.1